MLLLAILLGIPLAAQSIEQFEIHGAQAARTTYQGRPAIQLIAAPGAGNGASYAILKNSRFRDGVLEADVAGKPGPGAGSGARGFIGLAFRVADGKYEHIYLRPTNGRADDQVRRNHSAQYGAHPDYDFARLRKESPEKYESYVDLEPGVWTRMKIVVKGTSAQLFVHGAPQPCLIVTDLKLGLTEGAVALWIGPGTEGYFANLKIGALD